MQRLLRELPVAVGAEARLDGKPFPVTRCPGERGWGSRQQSPSHPLHLLGGQGCHVESSVPCQFSLRSSPPPFKNTWSVFMFCIKHSLLHIHSKSLGSSLGGQCVSRCRCAVSEAMLWWQAGDEFGNVSPSSESSLNQTQKCF